MSRTLLGMSVVLAVAGGLIAIDAATSASDAAIDIAAEAPKPTITPVAAAVLQGPGGPVTLRPGRQTTVIDVVIPPGVSTGWHSHPGSGMFLVTKGTLSTYGLNGPACKAVPLATGKALYFSQHARHTHLVRNEGAVPATLTVLYFDLAPGQIGRTEAPAPKGCNVT